MWRGGEDRGPCLTDYKALVGLVTSCPRSTLRRAPSPGGSSPGGCSIFDSASGLRSGLCEDFIEREKGLGTLRRYVKGQVLDPSRSRGMTVIQRSRLGASATHLGRGDRTPGPSRPFDPPEADFQLGGSSIGGCSIFDRVSGPRSGLYEDFIEREKGIGNLEEVCEGASPRSLAKPRDDSYTKVTPRRICDRVNGPARPPGFRLGGRNDGIAKVSLGGEGTGPRPLSTLRSSRGGLSAQRILHRRMFHLR